MLCHVTRQPAARASMILSRFQCHFHSRKRTSGILCYRCTCKSSLMIIFSVSKRINLFLVFSVLLSKRVTDKSVIWALLSPHSRASVLQTNVSITSDKTDNSSTLSAYIRVSSFLYHVSSWIECYRQEILEEQKKNGWLR